MGTANFHSKISPVRVLQTYADSINSMDNEDLINMYAVHIEDLDPSDPDDADELRQYQHEDGSWNREALVEEALTSESGAMSFWQLQTEEINMRLADFKSVADVDFTPISIQVMTPRASDELRSYPAICVGQLLTSFFYKGINIGVGMEVILRSGYYEGRNFDYRLFVDCDYSYDPLFIDEYEPTYSYARALIDEIADADDDEFDTINVDELKALIYSEITKLVKNFDLLTAPLCNNYKVVAQYSNGETVYQKEADNA